MEDVEMSSEMKPWAGVCKDEFITAWAEQSWIPALESAAAEMLIQT